MGEFIGFPERCLAFLSELKANNSREWFNQRQGDFETSVREPSLAFISAALRCWATSRPTSVR